MRNRRFNNTVAVLTAVAALVIAPASASAGSLLSGYGGPGEGNQAILGSALVNGPGGGGAGGSAHSRSAAQSVATGAAGAGEASPASGSSGAAAPARSAAPGRTRASRAGSGSAPGTRARAGVPAAGAAAAAAAAAATSGSSAASAPAGQTLGLTGTDLLYVLLVVAALALTGFATSRIARRPEVGTRAG